MASNQLAEALAAISQGISGGVGAYFDAQDEQRKRKLQMEELQRQRAAQDRELATTRYKAAGDLARTLDAMGNHQGAAAALSGAAGDYKTATGQDITGLFNPHGLGNFMKPGSAPGVAKTVGGGGNPAGLDYSPIKWQNGGAVPAYTKPDMANPVQDYGMVGPLAQLFSPQKVEYESIDPTHDLYRKDANGNLTLAHRGTPKQQTPHNPFADTYTDAQGRRFGVTFDGRRVLIGEGLPTDDSKPQIFGGPDGGYYTLDGNGVRQIVQGTGAKPKSFPDWLKDQGEELPKILNSKEAGDMLRADVRAWQQERTIGGVPPSKEEIEAYQNQRRQEISQDQIAAQKKRKDLNVLWRREQSQVTQGTSLPAGINPNGNLGKFIEAVKSGKL